MDIEFIEYDCDYLQYIKKWEQEKEIFNYMNNLRPKYLRKNFEKIKESTLFYIVKYENSIIGAVWLEDITTESGKLTVYIGEKEFRGRGIGTMIVYLMIEEGFAELNLKKIKLFVRSNNSKAINCYKKLGFKIKRTFPRQKLKSGAYEGSYEMVIYKK